MSGVPGHPPPARRAHRARIPTPGCGPLVRSTSSTGTHLAWIDLARCAYHQQNEDVWCGPAVAEIVLDFVGLASSPAGYQQDPLNNNIHNPPASLGAPCDGGSHIRWASAPHDLVSALGRVLPGLETYMLKDCHSEQQATQGLVGALQALGCPAIALVFGLSHWVVVRGVETAGVAKPLQVRSLDIYNPWPPLPISFRIRQFFRHDAMDQCGTGFQATGANPGPDDPPSRGAVLNNISYDEWRCFYMTGVPQTDASKTPPAPLHSSYCGKFVVMCAQQSGSAPAPAPCPGPAIAPTPVPAFPPAWSSGQLIGAQTAGTHALQYATRLAERSDWQPLLQPAGSTSPGFWFQEADVQLVQHQAQPKLHYYIVPIRTAQGAPVTIRVDAATGDYLEAIGVRPSLTPTTGPHTFATRVLSWNTINTRVMNQRVVIAGQPVVLTPAILGSERSLIWEPCGESLSPFAPFYRLGIPLAQVQILFGGRNIPFDRLFVGADGAMYYPLYVRSWDALVLAELTRGGAGM